MAYSKRSGRWTGMSTGDKCGIVPDLQISFTLMKGQLLQVCKRDRKNVTFPQNLIMQSVMFPNWCFFSPAQLRLRIRIPGFAFQPKENEPD
jgi:hypothetical protein